jgi:hypothetical protein
VPGVKDHHRLEEGALVEFIGFGQRIRGEDATGANETRFKLAELIGR